MDTRKSQKIKHALKIFETCGISHEPGDGVFEMMILYKELMENSSLSEIRQFEETLSPCERKVFILANLNTLSDTTALKILKNTYVRRCINQELEEYEQEFLEKQKQMIQKQDSLSKIKAQIQKELNTKKSEIGKLNLTIERLSQRNEQLKSELSGAVKKARAIIKNGVTPLQTC
ncbi:Uncharacterized protein dnl_62620 [Desulfonema limicola]|uniref:Uncharacterized protein n=1 Tax=Desulfonema limicola TaxID=45656 RepID=A0A975BEI5_9BACT|nr:hypothetical protein [Desulfonema limicola]QTA83843.1 Uncharacterized protein dnl_62620 [Desulfonema limicola]